MVLFVNRRADVEFLKIDKYLYLNILEFVIYNYKSVKTNHCGCHIFDTSLMNIDGDFDTVFFSKMSPIALFSNSLSSMRHLLLSKCAYAHPVHDSSAHQRRHIGAWGGGGG